MMTINWLEEVEKRKDELFADLFRQLKIASVREDDKATKEAPVGPGPRQALDDFMSMAKEDGFKTKSFEPWAGRIEMGEGDELVGIIGHLDVVPAGSGWETDPFDPVIKNDRIYARGSSDDKGPTIAAYMALKILRDLDVELNKRVHLIVGTDEESGWQCMDYYFEHAEMPSIGFSPDAVFPIINGEKGNVSLIITSKNTDNSDSNRLVTFDAGLRENMVPESATAVVQLQNDHLEEEFEKHLNQHKLDGTIEANDQGWKLTLVGKSAHGSTPEQGVNGATYLANFLKEYSFDKASRDFLQLVGDVLHDNFDGSSLNIDHVHDVMGPLSANVGLVNYNDQEGTNVTVNLRFPEGITPQEILERAQETLKDLPFEVAMSDFKEPHYVPADDPLVQTLLDVYHDHTGLPAHEMTIGGGTFGRLLPKGVAYGALFPDSIDTMHQANEFIAIEDLLKATAIYADAIYRLTR
ncbi:dipeptidase PepV [Dolosicoccus paucivorans]|uniref:Dipeptidase PepV n=1 Tax=Dolosicoccus paucivorans TaxID=84521 RepID=A0A2N6SLH1_9LACT|nr:dipeptidase PepV [Dolosicoccus paucivorans]PMB83957.1 dipeptidase PepV [Dolosicoccus paucivorans]PMC57889.1 dipeptidase PepV [Dolosicoccus paucivorans]